MRFSIVPVIGFSYILSGCNRNAVKRGGPPATNAASQQLSDKAREFDPFVVIVSDDGSDIDPATLKNPKLNVVVHTLDGKETTTVNLGDIVLRNRAQNEKVLAQHKVMAFNPDRIANPMPDGVHLIVKRKIETEKAEAEAELARIAEAKRAAEREKAAKEARKKKKKAEKEAAAKKLAEEMAAREAAELALMMKEDTKAPENIQPDGAQKTKTPEEIAAEEEAKKKAEEDKNKQKTPEEIAAEEEAKKKAEEDKNTTG